MQRSIATISVSGTLPEKLHAIAAAGFDAVEIFDQDLYDYHGTPIEIRKMAQNLGLKIALFQPCRNVEGESRDQWKHNLERVRRKFEIMHQLGCDRMLLCSNASAECSADINLQIADLSHVAQLAEQHGITVGYEALSWGTHVNHYRQAWDRVRVVNSPSMGIVLDSFHILARGDQLDQLVDIPLEKIIFVQLADAPRLDMDFQQWSRRFRCFPGQGALPIVEFARRLAEKGYSGLWSLEIFNQEFDRMKPLPVAENGFRSLQYIEQKITQSKALS
jgi:4-hydroxyphenylpyruvate dioxygenase